MLDKLKGLLWGSEEKDDEEEGFFLKIRVSPLSLVKLMEQTVEQVYGQNDQFYIQYTRPLLKEGNQELNEQLGKHITFINAQKYPNIKYYQLLSEEIGMEEGYIVCLFKLWFCYIENRIKNSSKDSLDLFREEVYYLKKLVNTIFARIYQPSEHLYSQLSFKQSSAKFKVKLICELSEFHDYKKIKSIIINKCKNSKGIAGQFSNSQVALTGFQFQQLVKFKEIPAPFNQTIAIVLDLYREHRIINQANILVQVVSSAKKQIMQYRQFFNMGSAVVGADQVIPILNFICEKSQKNIYAITRLIKCWLGDKRVYSDVEARDTLQLINPEADYCLNLIESVSTMYCHASKMMN